MKSETNQWVINLQPQREQHPNVTLSGVRQLLIAWIEFCNRAISQTFIDNSKVQPGECKRDSNGWWYTIHPKSFRPIYADSRGELQQRIRELSSRPHRRLSPWF